MGGALADEADDVVEGGVVAELELVVAFDAVGFADGGEEFGLFDGVDAEVGFEVEIEIEHLGWVAGLFGDQRQDPCGDGIALRLGSGRRGRDRRRDRRGRSRRRDRRGRGDGRRSRWRGDRGRHAARHRQCLGRSKRGGARPGTVVDDAQAAADDLEPWRGLARGAAQPGVPPRLIDDAIGEAEFIGGPVASVGERCPAQQDHADLRAEAGSETQGEAHGIRAATRQVQRSEIRVDLTEVRHRRDHAGLE